MEGQNLNVVRHPLIQNKLTYLRNKNTDNQDFRLILEELTTLMVYEITRNYPLAETEVETPLEKTTSKTLDTKVALVPILRAGDAYELALPEKPTLARRGGRWLLNRLINAGALV
ncbi:MAG: uracil phosphoribosyltransferase, partial [Candidatus Bipolaricaulia bacterium]